MKYLFAFIIIALIAVGCTKTGNNNDTCENNTVDIPLDAIIIPPAPEPPIKVHTALDYKIKQTEEALRFMRTSIHWPEYKQGVIPRIAEQDVKYAQKLLASKHPYFIIVDKSSMYVILYDRYGVEVDRYRMCCSRNYGTKHAKRDNRTPEGFFSAGITYDSTDWLYTDDDGKTSKVKGQYGPRFIRITNPVTTQVGIHGTCAPWSLGGRSSHGCIRIHNDNIMKLVEYVTPGTPVIINPSNRDQAVNQEEGYTVVQLHLGKKRIQPKKQEKPDSVNKSVIPDSISSHQDSIPESETPEPLHPKEQDSTMIKTTSV
ncbi:MAG: L,D-transpeptidase family protein [Paramuribaculum sp.]|nr:L,D-transpeptidase family protein [Paramuribaculum sp.]